MNKIQMLQEFKSNLKIRLPHIYKKTVQYTHKTKIRDKVLVLLTLHMSDVIQ